MIQCAKVTQSIIHTRFTDITPDKNVALFSIQRSVFVVENQRAYGRDHDSSIRLGGRSSGYWVVGPQ